MVSSFFISLHLPLECIFWACEHGVHPGVAVQVGPSDLQGEDGQAGIRPSAARRAMDAEFIQLLDIGN